MQFHGHVFIWHNQLPNWLTSGTWTREELVAILHDHIDQVGGYLKGKVALWDVVNEPFNGDGTWRSSVWNDVIDADNSATDQRDYIDLAFQRARQVDPDAKLILNDYSVFTLNNKSDALYAWAQSMVNRGIPLDGVGFQMHMTGPTNYGRFAQNMQRFADLGLEVHVTELDVRVPVPFTTQKAIDQADVYRQVIRRVLDQPAVKTFTMWGFTDAHSWIPTFFPGTDNALIFDKYYNPKPAFVALREELLY
jgi:endo-1,4-beta-xylanase